jgi:hypothetical protein
VLSHQYVDRTCNKIAPGTYLAKSVWIETDSAAVLTEKQEVLVNYGRGFFESNHLIGHEVSCDDDEELPSASGWCGELTHTHTHTHTHAHASRHGMSFILQ